MTKLTHGKVIQELKTQRLTFLTIYENKDRHNAQLPSSPSLKSFLMSSAILSICCKSHQHNYTDGTLFTHLILRRFGSILDSRMLIMVDNLALKSELFHLFDYFLSQMLEDVLLSSKILSVDSSSKFIFCSLRSFFLSLPERSVFLAFLLHE